MLVRLLLSFALSLLFISVEAQPNKKTFFAYHLGFNAGVSTIGALINKKKNESATKILAKAFLQGALGGYCIYQSRNAVKKLDDSNHKKYQWAWTAKLLNTTGSSICENAASNLSFWKRWHINLGFNRLTLQKLDEKFQFKYQAMPFSLFSSIWASFQGNLSLKRSLQYGTPFFIKPIDVRFSLDNLLGQASSNSIIIMRDYGEGSIAHELIHAYQYENLVSFNSFFDKPRAKFSSKSKLLKVYSKWVYSDFNEYIFGRLYLLEGGKTEENYCDNFYEQEAFYFSNTTCGY